MKGVRDELGHAINPKFKKDATDFDDQEADILMELAKA